jgi:RHS repeat-associated protein
LPDLSRHGVAIAAGASHSLAIRNDGTVCAWGLNSSGQLGNNSTTNAKSPVQVRNLTGATAVAGGASHSLALKSDGTVWAWGLNSSGQLGNGTTTTSKIPVQVKNLTNIIAIAAGANDSLALKSDGTVWAWGLNSSGQLGNGTTTNATTPVQVKNLTGIATIGSGASHSLYATTVGVASAAGLNGSGQLGNGTTVNASTAVAVTNLHNVASSFPAAYTYDGDGLRASATSQGATQHYAWDTTATNPLLLTDGSTSYIYGPDDLPVEQISSAGTISYYHHDQLGSTRLLTSSTGTVTATYSYSPYGQLTSQTGSTDTPLRWAGQYQDASTGSYYLRARYYDPRTGQFLTRDPLVAISGAAYAYGGDDPLNATDPSGDLPPVPKWCIQAVSVFAIWCHQKLPQPSQQNPLQRPPAVTRTYDPPSGGDGDGSAGQGGTGAGGGDGTGGDGGGGDDGNAPPNPCEADFGADPCGGGGFRWPWGNGGNDDDVPPLEIADTLPCPVTSVPVRFE